MIYKVVSSKKAKKHMNIIAVKGMKMPNNCHECPLYNEGSIWGYCEFSKKDVEFSPYDKIRAEDCPLFEISENGYNWIKSLNQVYKAHEE